LTVFVQLLRFFCAAVCLGLLFFGLLFAIYLIPHIYDIVRAVIVTLPLFTLAE
jgi:hypothetical protein